MAVAGTIMLRKEFSDMFEERLPYIDEIMFENYDAPSMVYQEVYNVRDSSRMREQITEVSGFGRFVKKPEGEKVSYDQLLQGFDKTFTHDTWGKGWAISFEGMQDDMDNIISDATPALGRAGRNSIEATLAANFNGAFNTVTVPQGGYLVGSGHNLLYGASQSNLITGDLSQSSLESALNKFGDMVDLRNELVNIDPMILLVPFELQWRAYELLESVQRADTSNNAINVLTRLGLKIVVWRYLTSATAWFLMSDPNMHRLMCYWRMQPTVDHAIDFDTNDGKTKMLYRMSHGPAHWLGIAGSQGGV